MQFLFWPLSLLSLQTIQPHESRLQKAKTTQPVRIYSQHQDTTWKPKIVSKPIQYGEERRKLSLEYLAKRHGIIQTSPTIIPKIVVVHYTAGGSAMNTISYFNRSRIEDARAYNKDHSPLNVSSQYLIDRDGTIYKLMEDTMFARHVIGLNYCSIGIENVGSDTNPLTDQQLEANAALIRILVKKHRIEYVIGHQEYGRFRGSSLWKETDPKYFNGKGDPGKDFMARLRVKLQDLNLKSAPEATPAASNR